MSLHLVDLKLTAVPKPRAPPSSWVVLQDWNYYSSSGCNQHKLGMRLSLLKMNGSALFTPTIKSVTDGPCLRTREGLNLVRIRIRSC